ncbi:hypothetical protein Q0Z83_068990 [Actinoplanes sichuanensis]|nr:hypothetical protein Q0Z83_068990 [Actinoplanes sichuanensis]
MPDAVPASRRVPNGTRKPNNRCHPKSGLLPREDQGSGTDARLDFDLNIFITGVERLLGV